MGVGAGGVRETKASHRPHRDRRNTHCIRAYHVGVSEPVTASTPAVDPARAERLRRDAQRPMSTNLAQGISLSHTLLSFVGVARGG